MINSMTNTSTSLQKLMGKINGYDFNINKSGELPRIGVENDSIIVKVGKEAYALTVLSKSQNINNRNPQLEALKDVGKIVYDYFKSSKETDEKENENDNDKANSNGIYYYMKIDLDKSYLGRKNK